MLSGVTPGQIHSDFIHQAPGHLYLTSSSWSFEMWGIDVIGPITPLTSKGHRFILVITDYFSKWAEDIPLKEVKTSNVVNFIKHHVLYRFDVPQRIIHDNGPQFVSHFRDSIINSDFKVSSTTYYPAANGLAEAFNKTMTNFSRSSP